MAPKSTIFKAELQITEMDRNRLARFDNLGVFSLDDAAVAALGQMAQRAMRLQCTISDAQLWFSNGTQAIVVAPKIWKRARA